MTLRDDDPLAVAVTAALHDGDLAALRRLLGDHPGLATSRIVSGGDRRGSRTLLHVYADWPGRRPRAREVVAVLREAGADVDAPLVGAHAETALDWAGATTTSSSSTPCSTPGPTSRRPGQ